MLIAADIPRMSIFSIMKIRCVENSIRLRAKKSELAKLATDHRIEESIAFPNGQTLTYALSISDIVDQVNPIYYENNIEIQLPKTLANEWINSDTVSIDCTIELEGDEHLDILIEKDFPCLDRPSEDKSDTFFELVPNTPDKC